MWFIYYKHRERTQKFKQKDVLKYLFDKELDKACFAQVAAYANSKDLVKRIVSDKILKDRA